jgi:hypothetical protein
MLRKIGAKMEPGRKANEIIIVIYPLQCFLFNNIVTNGNATYVVYFTQKKSIRFYNFFM